MSRKNNLLKLDPHNWFLIISQENSKIGEVKMDKLQFRIDAEKCIQCDACVNDCPSEILHRERAIPEAKEGACLECQHCLAVCPEGAISVFGLKAENSLPLLEGTLPSYHQMKTFVRGRRSVRQFLDEDIPTALIDGLLADLAHAPTGCNDRDLTFSLVPDRKTVGMLREKILTSIELEQKKGTALDAFIEGALFAYRRDGKDFIFRGAPHLLIVSPGEKAHCGVEDAVLALAYFELLAQSANLGTTWCGVIKIIADMVPGTRELLGLPPDAYFYAMMFGKPAVSYARTVQRDSAARIRRLLVTR